MAAYHNYSGEELHTLNELAFIHKVSSRIYCDFLKDRPTHYNKVKQLGNELKQKRDELKLPHIDAIKFKSQEDFNKYNDMVKFLIDIIKRYAD